LRVIKVYKGGSFVTPLISELATVWK